MFKQNKIRSRVKISKNYYSQKSIKSDNLSTSNTNSNEKSKCLFPTISLATPNENCESKHPQFMTRALENAAVHFGDFYGVQNNDGKAYHNNLAEEETTTTKKKRRSNFTRQMVHKLEQAIDMEDYARQISVFLKETIEPPNFRSNPFLSENSIPDGSRRFSRYPSWYKEPYKKFILDVLKSNHSN